MSKKLRTSRTVGLFVAVALLLGVVVVPNAHAALTEAQIQSILTLLSSFGADSATIANVNGALRGQPTSGAPSSGAAVSCSFTRDLSDGVSGSDVKCLQQYLNGAGHVLASSGAGSPGSETEFYGPLTRGAVAKWQAANGVAPAVGYFGPISRAKYNSLVSAAPSTPSTPSTPSVPVAVGSGLTVSAPASQPAETLAPQSAARVPFVKMVLTASADGDVTVKNVVVERTGLADNAAFDGILLLDEDGTQIGNSKTLSSDNKVTLTDGLVVKAGTSKTVTVAANMASSLSSQAGQAAKLKVLSIDAGESAVQGVLPIESNAMTINSTLTIGSVTMSIGALDPGAANTKNVGTKGYYLASVRAGVGSAEDVTFEQIRFNQVGSAAGGDIANVVVQTSNDNKEYPAVRSSDGKFYVVKFPGGLKVAKGKNVDFSIKADLVGGSSRTVDMDVQKKTDIVVKGDTFGYHIIVGGGSSGAASAGGFSSNQEPFFNAYAATIDKGSLLVASSNKVPAGNVAVDVSDVTIGAFLFDVKGEPMQISSFRLTYTFTGTGTSTDMTGVKIMTEAGSILAGPKDGVANGITYTDTFTLPTGENHLLIKAKLDNTFVSNDTVQVHVDPDDSLTVKGQVTGLSVTATPGTSVTANTQTVRAGALAMSVSPTPFGQNVVRGVNAFHFATFNFDAGSSGEDVRVTSVKIRDTMNAAGSGNEVNSCQLFDGATALNTGSDVVNPSDPTGTTNDLTFTLTNNLIIPKGTIKKVDLKCNISSSAANNSFHQFGLNDTTGSAVVGGTTGQAITETVTTNAGSIMTVKTAGSYTVTKDASAPTAAMVLSGKTDVPMNVLKFTATDEAVNIEEITLTYSSSTASTSDFLKVTIWDGATKIGEAVWAGTAQNATSTLTSPFVVPKDGNKLMTLKADLASISTVASTTAGRLLAIDYNGVSSTTGVGQSSGQRLGSSSGSNSDGASMQIMKSFPTLAKIAVPSTSIPQTDAILYRFSVKADAAGPVALYKLTFQVSSSSISATSSNFRVFAYTDSGFASAAYVQNPTHTDNVDCISLSNLDRTSGCDAVVVGDIDATDGTGGNAASSTDVVWFFGPAANTSSTTEAVIIPAGSTYYFELRGDITNPGSGTGNTIQVSLLGDAARPVRVNSADSVLAGPPGSNRFLDGGRGFLGTAAAVAAQSANNDFVWSPISTTTATSTTDWTNGFLVPGLPSTNMSANTFSN